MIKHLVCCLLLACLCASPLLAQAPAGKPAEVAGFIVATRVRGEVTIKSTVTGVVSALTENQRISEGYVVTTSKSGSVILIFENGATVSIQEDSDLDIKKFEMDPFSGPETHIADLQQEPTVSNTVLSMSRGKLVGKVVHLNYNGGSEFTIQTPVGAAGIRGTTFELVFIPNPDGTAVFQLETSSGKVFFTGTIALTGVNVPTGKQISTVVNATSTTGSNGTTTYTGTGTISSSDLTTAQLTAIAAEAQVIVDTVLSTNIVLTASSTTTSSSTSTTTTSTSSSSSTSSSTSTSSSAQSQSGSAGTLNTPGQVTTTPGD